jgi:hypothetical protein
MKILLFLCKAQCLLGLRSIINKETTKNESHYIIYKYTIFFIFILSYIILYY